MPSRLQLTVSAQRSVLVSQAFLNYQRTQSILRVASHGQHEEMVIIQTGVTASTPWWRIVVGREGRGQKGWKEEEEKEGEGGKEEQYQEVDAMNLED